MLNNLLAVISLIPCDLHDMACWGFCQQLPLEEMFSAQRREHQVGWFTPWVAVEWRQNGLSTRDIVSLSFHSYLLDMESAYNLYL